MVFLGKFFEWRSALVLVKPGTLIGWHRKGFRLFWHWKSRPRGRPKLSFELQQLIRTMGADNPTWGEARIADELQLKLGIRVSPRTVRKYRCFAKKRSPFPNQANQGLCDLLCKRYTPG
jgi:putative transposase